MSKWKNNNKEGFQAFNIFGNDYFLNCIDHTGKIPEYSNMVKEGFKKFIDYIFCPIFHADMLITDIIIEIVISTNRIPCPNTDYNNSNTASIDIDAKLREVNDGLNEIKQLDIDAKKTIKKTMNYQLDITVNNPIVKNTVQYFYENYNDWMNTDAVKENVLVYYLNALNDAQTKKGHKFKDHELTTFNNKINESFSNPDIMNALLTTTYTIDIDSSDTDITDTDTVLPKNESKNCTHLDMKDVNNIADIIKREIYGIFLLPIALFITYNLYYTFIFNNEYGNPEVYILDLMAPYNKLSSVFMPLINESMKDNHIEEIINYFFGLLFKPYEYLHDLFKTFYTRHNVEQSFINIPLFNFNTQKNTNVVFTIILLFTYIFLHNYGASFFSTIKAIFTFDLKTFNNPVFSFVSSICLIIIWWEFGKWVVNKILKTVDALKGTNGNKPPNAAGIYATIFMCVITIVFRFIIATLSMFLARVICIIYSMFYIFFAMKYLSIRNNYLDVISKINKTLNHSLEKPENKPWFNKLLKIIENVSLGMMLVIYVVIYSMSNLSKIHDTTVKIWFFIINVLIIILAFIFIESRVKDITNNKMVIYGFTLIKCISIVMMILTVMNISSVDVIQSVNEKEKKKI